MKSPVPLMGRGLYVITNGPRPDLLDVAALALSGGARLMQYRDQTNDAARRRTEAAALRQLCHAHGIPLIINADVALARAVTADGVHLGPQDGEIAMARDALGDHAIIGMSCGNSLQRAESAVAAGADYVSFGAFFQSPTKPWANRAPIELLRQTDALGVPRVAIGGITPDNGKPLVDAGAAFLATVSAVFGATDVRAAAQRFNDLYSTNT